MWLFLHYFASLLHCCLVTSINTAALSSCDDDNWTRVCNQIMQYEQRLAGARGINHTQVVTSKNRPSVKMASLNLKVTPQCPRVYRPETIVFQSSKSCSLPTYKKSYRKFQQREIGENVKMFLVQLLFTLQATEGTKNYKKLL